MASPKVGKVHFANGDPSAEGHTQKTVCGRPLGSVQYVDATKPVAHRSGRLMRASERRQHHMSKITCSTCSARAGS